MQYSKERKNAIINKMKAPNSKTIPELSKEEGISEPTLYNWRQEARSKGILLPNGEKTPNGWSSTDMFAAVVESASFNEEELAQL